MEIEREDSGQNSQSWWIPWQRGRGMDPRSRSPAKDTAGPGVEADTTGMGPDRRPSRGNEAVGPMPDTYGYWSTRPEPGSGGLGAAPRGESPPSDGCPEGRLVIRLKTYLRSTMTTERLMLNSMMVLHVHRNLLDDIQDAPIVDEFVACNEMRKDIFGV